MASVNSCADKKISSEISVWNDFNLTREEKTSV